MLKFRTLIGKGLLKLHEFDLKTTKTACESNTFRSMMELHLTVNCISLKQIMLSSLIF